jgi:hypothetical protein
VNIEEAQRQINQILADLEADTGSVVKTLTLNKIEVTSYFDTSVRYEVTSVIELERLPSQNWNT